MKILLDNCVWGGAQAALADAGHDVEWVGDWEQDPGDEQILAHATLEGRALVTLDKDFGELAILRRQTHAGIVRLVNIPAREQGPICVIAFGQYQKELQSGAIVTVERSRVRIRKADSVE